MKSTCSKVAVLFVACLALPVVLLSQSSALDLKFGTDGIVTTSIAEGSDEAYSGFLQSDGKIVVAGTSNNGSNSDFAIVRYNTNGSMDSTFDRDGKVITAIGTGNDAVMAVVVQSDGKIVAVGYCTNGVDQDFALVRYNTDGSLDNTFDGDGKVTTAFGTGSDRANSVVVQRDGKIVVAGFLSSGGFNEFAVARYNANGSLDNTFDTDGKVSTLIGAKAVAKAVALQSDGKIVVAGYCDNLDNKDVALARYNTNGSLDNTFDTDGMLTTAIGTGDDAANSMIVQSDGKIVVAGYCSSDRERDFALLCYNANGSLDKTFDSDGVATTNVVNCFNEEGKSVTLQNDGKIVVAGDVRNRDDGNFDFGIVRYNTNGTVDNTFDTDGMFSARIGTSHDVVAFVDVQSDGKIVVAGCSKNGSVYDFALLRYR